jgi:RimJ/RimL family protein N-acetyltransferase
MGDPNTSPTFAIRSREDGRLLGMCALKDIRWASRHAMCWIGIGDPAMRGRGYGSDAMRVLLRFAFMDMNLNCIALEVFSYNKPALAAYRKLGFKDDGVLRAYLYRDGEYYDMHLMSMLRGEWSVLYGGQ